MKCGIAARTMLFYDAGILLLLQRASNPRTNPDYSEIPGGKTDAGENVVSALSRRVEEEIGLVIESVRFNSTAEQRITDILTTIHLIFDVAFLLGPPSQRRS